MSKKSSFLGSSKADEAVETKAEAPKVEAPKAAAKVVEKAPEPVEEKAAAPSGPALWDWIETPHGLVQIRQFLPDGCAFVSTKTGHELNIKLPE